MTAQEIEQTLEALEAQFMRPEITGRSEWLVLDGPQGVEFIPCELFGWRPEPHVDYYGPVPPDIAEYCENSECWEITTRWGYGARLSAPGYMDATAWTLHDSVDEAREALAEMYGDD